MCKNFTRSLLLSIILVLVFCGIGIAGEQNSEQNSENINQNNLGLVISAPPETINNMRGSPGITSGFHTELPSYFGPYGATWNDQASTILPFTLMHSRHFYIEEVPFYKFECDCTKNSIRYLNKIEGKKFDEIVVLNGVVELQGVRSKIVAYITAYGDRKKTTMDCFNQVLISTYDAKANVFLLLAASSSPGVHSTTIGIGSSGAGNFSQDGKEAYSGGMSTGYSSNTGGPTSNPFVHGVALLISDREMKKIQFRNMLN